MISDTLSDAIASLDEYRTQLADSYKELGPEIDAVVATMRALLTILDAPPIVPADLEAAADDIRKLLIALPVDDLENAVASLQRVAGEHRKGGG